MPRQLTKPLPIVPGAWLPEIGWFGIDDLRRDCFRPVALWPNDMLGNDVGSKPFGGLWCAPTVRRLLGGHLLGTTWTERRNGFDGTIALVKPDRDARILVINGNRQLTAICERWPDSRQHFRVEEHLGRKYLGRYSRRPTTRIDWVAMANEIDAVFLTERGYQATRQPTWDGTPHLAGWDTPTVLFLQPAFTVGETVAVHPRSVAAEEGELAALAFRPGPVAREMLLARFEEIATVCRAHL